MSFIEKFNYNRDSLTDGGVVGFTGSPIYGSSINFTADNSSWNASSYYNYIMPRSLNSIKAEMELTFQGNADNIKSILRRIENATTGVLTGDIAFSGTEDCINFGESKNDVQINLDTGYYKNFSGSQISNYNLKHIASDVYELNVSMFNNRVSSVLNNGMGFVADNTVDIEDSSFEVFDIAKLKNLALFDNSNEAVDAESDRTFVELETPITLTGEFDISFSTILTGYLSDTDLDPLSGAHFLACNLGVHTADRDRFFHWNDNGTLKISFNVDNITYNFTDVAINLNQRHDIKITRDSSDDIRLFIDGSQHTDPTTHSAAGNFTFNSLGGPWGVPLTSSVPPLNGTMFDISVKSGSSLTEVLNIKGYGTNASDWSSSVNGYEFTSTISGELKEFYSNKNSQVFDNYFYLTGSRGSAISASNVSGLATYTGFADDSTRTFFWEPDQQVSVPVNHSTRINEFKGSFLQQLNISKNQNRLEQLQLIFSNRGQKETYAILHFLESHLGYKQFVYYYDDDIIKQNRIFYCPQWSHTFNYKDSNTIEATFFEIVVPVAPEF